jgi:TPR repeat protein
MLAIEYSDPQSLTTLGFLYMTREDKRVEAFQFLQKAADLGDIHALARIGQLFSPLSEMAFVEKNATQAVALFERVKERTPEDLVMCFEYAKLLFNGVGVEKDQATAQRLWEIARQQDQTLGPLVEIAKPEPAPVEGSTGTSVLIGIGIAALAAAAVFASWRMLRMRLK